MTFYPQAVVQSIGHAIAHARNFSCFSDFFLSFLMPSCLSFYKAWKVKVSKKEIADG